MTGAKTFRPEIGWKDRLEKINWKRSTGPRPRTAQTNSPLSMPVDAKTPKPGIEAASLTAVGPQRANNEDSFLYWEPDSDEDFRRKGRLPVVADGRGG